MRIDDLAERNFYEIEAQKQNLTVQLKRPERAEAPSRIALGNYERKPVAL